MKIDSEGGAQEVSHGESSGSGQERLHVDGLRERVHITVEVHHHCRVAQELDGAAT